MRAAKCSLVAFQGVMKLGIPETSSGADGLKPMMVATDPALLELLVRQGMSVDARGPRGRTPLMFHRTPEVTRLLLGHGAHARLLDNEGRSALHFGGPADKLAACYELLLAAGADPNLQDRTEHRDTPLLP